MSSDHHKKDSNLEILCLGDLRTATYPFFCIVTAATYPFFCIVTPQTMHSVKDVMFTAHTAKDSW